jgi:serine/threonine protein kinase
MAPEVVQRQTHTYKADLWSLGVVLYYMIYRKYPFTARMRRMPEILEKCIPYFDLAKNLGVTQYL